ncbi:MAG TPA: hypothetical protein PKA37_12535, partial [Planctomycetota bacterium]|nr:hypothetical protein [Planctomycetota bacterium]
MIFTAINAEREVPAHADPEQGSILIVTMNVILVLTVLAGAFLLTTLGANREQGASADGMRAFYLAETALNTAMADISAGGTGILGRETDPHLFDGGGFWADTAELPGRRVIVATGMFQGHRRSLEGIVDATGTGTGFFKDGLKSSGDTRILGETMVDSYDSRLGTYDSQALGLSPRGKARANTSGTVSSAGSVTVGSFAEVFGNTTGSTVNLDPGAYVFGATFPSLVGTDFPPVIPPTIVGPLLNAAIPAGRTKVDQGEYAYGNILLTGTGELEFVGPATVVVSSLSVTDDAKLTIDSTYGPVFIYVLDSVSITGNAVVGSRDQIPKDLLIATNLDNTTGFEGLPLGNPASPIMIGGSANLFGMLYAPNGTVGMEGTSEFHGAVAARRIILNDGTSLHFDESL